jgi:hypothetical protein
MSQFMSQFQAPLHGVLHWQQWNTLIERLNCESDGSWYVYFVGEPVPVAPLSTEQFRQFLHEIDQLLRNDHQEEHLGNVYADNLESSAFIKIYDPNNLGSSCGSSGKRVLPGWTISRTQPVDLHAEFPNPGGRRRWWHRLFAPEGQTDGVASTRAAGGQQ